MTDPIADLRAGLTNCGRCGAPTEIRRPFLCVWCRRHLCAVCYQDHGHCGHAELDEIRRREVERARARPLGLFEQREVRAMLPGNTYAVRAFIGTVSDVLGLGILRGKRPPRRWFSAAEVEQLQELLAQTQGTEPIPDWAMLRLERDGNRFNRMRWIAQGRKRSGQREKVTHTHLPPPPPSVQWARAGRLWAACQALRAEIDDTWVILRGADPAARLAALEDAGYTADSLPPEAIRPNLRPQ